MYIYETCLILSAQVPDGEIDELVEKLQKPLLDGGAEIQKSCRWGRRRLAYPINKQADGFYVVFFYDLTTPGDVIATFERSCRYNDNVLRVVTIKVPKKIHGEEIQPLQPEPGFAADFNMAPRPRHARRREGEAFDRGRRPGPPRGDAPRPDEGPAAVAAEDKPEDSESGEDA
jgi:small subunit ribosomal protein S6